LSEELEEDLKKIIGELESIAKRLNMPIQQLIPIMTHREIVILNQQLRAIHEHLDMIEEKSKEP
jgi:hypothetical protein